MPTKSALDFQGAFLRRKGEISSVGGVVNGREIQYNNLNYHRKLGGLYPKGGGSDDHVFAVLRQHVGLSAVDDSL